MGISEAVKKLIGGKIDGALPGFDKPFMSPERDLVGQHESLWVALESSSVPNAVESGIGPSGMGMFLFYPIAFTDRESALADANSRLGSESIEILKVDVSACNPSSFVAAERVGGPQGAFAVFSGLPACVLSREEFGNAATLGF